MKNWLQCVLSFLLLCSLGYIVLSCKSQEGFMNDYYKPKLEHVNPANASTISSLKHTNGTNNTYEQKTNNQRNWNQPDNGTCTPSDICDVYEKRETSEQPKATPPDFMNGNRINFYTFESLEDDL